MNEDILHGIAAELNGAPQAADRVDRMKTLVHDINDRVAAEALRALPFDSSPYGFPTWLAAADKP